MALGTESLAGKCASQWSRAVDLESRSQAERSFPTPTQQNRNPGRSESLCSYLGSLTHAGILASHRLTIFMMSFMPEDLFLPTQVLR